MGYLDDMVEPCICEYQFVTCFLGLNLFLQTTRLAMCGREKMQSAITVSANATPKSGAVL